MNKAKLKRHSSLSSFPPGLLRKTGRNSRELSIESLTQSLDAFRAGYLREAALIWESMEERDDTIHVAASKRKKAVSRLSYEILTLNGSAAAQAHREALEHFYRNLRVTHAMDENETGGLQLLIRQMMDAIGKRYAVHEIIWIPSPEGSLSAELRFVPLWCFENTTGKLRFCPSEFTSAPQELEPGGWMISVGEGLMTACSIACLFKRMPLRDWLFYCRRHGFPAVLGTTPAERGSAEWSDMQEALEDFSHNSSVLISSGENIQVIERSDGRSTPFPALVEEMTRAIITLWRGGDLSTRSIHYGAGATMQQDEALLMEIDDAEWISETIHTQLDTWVIRWLFGPDIKPLARFHLNNTQKSSIETDLKVDEVLLKHGAPLSLAKMLRRYQRAMPTPGELLAESSTPLQELNRFEQTQPTQTKETKNNDQIHGKTLS